MYKFRLRAELAVHDEKELGYEYEVWEVKNNSKKVWVRFQDNNGNWRQVLYKKRRVEAYIKAGDWILSTPVPSASERFDREMAFDM